MLKENESQLSLQMLEIEEKMDEQEQEFRNEQSKKPLGSELGRPFDYLLQRLHCDLNDDGRLGQAQTYVKMVREILDNLKRELDTRGFGSNAVTYDFGRIHTGLGILDSIMHQETHAETDQHTFDLVYDGIEKRINEVRKLVEELDTRLRGPVG